MSTCVLAFRRLAIIASLFMLAGALPAREYHVSAKAGDDAGDGSASKPFKTIMAAARLAQPGDIVTVHSGTYRERVSPPRGGESDARRIVYRTDRPDSIVEIKGSEVIKNWQKAEGGVWKVLIPNAFFGNYNPYKDVIWGDWFTNKGRDHHTGEVYLNGKSLYEMEALDKVKDPRPIAGIKDPEGSTWTWFCQVDDANTTIWANFHDKDPNKERVEINVREACFFPEKTGCNYITVSGFHMSQAATQWAPPTAFQIGLIGPNWARGWIIENNVIRDSKCSGICLGKERESGHNVWLKDPTKGGDVHYNETIVKVLKLGWNKETVGSHIVRNNIVSNCEQAGIVGSMGCAFATVTGNHVHDIWTKRMFAGAEIAAIKFHGAIDAVIANNSLHDSGKGLWLDWMAQGTHVTGNLCYNNDQEDLFVEVDHGPFLVDNNIFLSPLSILSVSEGGAFAHNLIAGLLTRSPDKRTTPFHKPHSTEVVALEKITGGDDRFYNNIFVGKGSAAAAAPAKKGKAARPAACGTDVYPEGTYPVFLDGNVYLNGAKPSPQEKEPVVKADFDPQLKLESIDSHDKLTMSLDGVLKGVKTSPVTTERLGKAKIAQAGYEHPDGTPVRIDRDYFGKPRNPENPTPGPFENPGESFSANVSGSYKVIPYKH